MKLDLLYEVDCPKPWEEPHPLGQRKDVGESGLTAGRLRHHNHSVVSFAPGARPAVLLYL